MYFVCECGDKFRDIKSDARDHVRMKHKQLVDVEFNLLLGAPVFGSLVVETVGASKLYDKALDILTDEMMDALYDDED